MLRRFRKQINPFRRWKARGLRAERRARERYQRLVVSLSEQHKKCIDAMRSEQWNKARQSPGSLVV